MLCPRTLKPYLLVLAILSCGQPGNEPKNPDDTSRLPALKDRYAAALIEAQGLRDAHGWITTEDCDAMLWTGKYAASTLVEGVDIGAAEYPEQPGRFARRPLDIPCTSENPEWSSWSRDMGTGLMAYALRKHKLDILERHAAFGEAHLWSMGEPLGDARAVYTPSFKGKLYQTIWALGGKDNINRLWPDFYPSGLVDYQAHLQVMNIWQRGEISKIQPSSADSHQGEPVVDDPGGPAPPQNTLIGIDNQMLDRLREHAERDPRDPFFQAVYSQYTGKAASAYDALLAGDGYAGEYVRCENQRACFLAAWIFAADIVIRGADGFRTP